MDIRANDNITIESNGANVIIRADTIGGQVIIHCDGVLQLQSAAGKISMPGMQSGATQAAAGAAANELWHRTTDNVVCMGI